jgi:hypothetical protein
MAPFRRRLCFAAWALILNRLIGSTAKVKVFTDAGEHAVKGHTTQIPVHIYMSITTPIHIHMMIPPRTRARAKKIARPRRDGAIEAANGR